MDFVLSCFWGIFFEASMDEWLERWTYNLEAQSSGSTLTSCQQYNMYLS